MYCMPGSLLADLTWSLVPGGVASVLAGRLGGDLHVVDSDWRWTEVAWSVNQTFGFLILVLCLKWSGGVEGIMTETAHWGLYGL